MFVFNLYAYKKNYFFLLISIEKILKIGISQNKLFRKLELFKIFIGGLYEKIGYHNVSSMFNFILIDNILLYVDKIIKI